MSGGILVIAEHRRGSLLDPTREAVSAGAELKAAGLGSLALAVIARDPAAFRAQASLSGLDEIIEVATDCGEFDADVYLQAVEAVVRQRQPVVVLAGFTANGMAVGPVLAARLALGLATDVTEIGVEDGGLVACRQSYGGKVEAELDFTDHAGAVLLLRPTAWTPAADGSTPAARTFAVEIDATRLRSRHRELIDPPTSDVDLSKAQFILSIGRGAGDRENLPRFEALAEKMGATLGASRPLIDAGWLPSWRQVGQSGVIVKPKVYLALGISGAAQHIAGMKASETVIAVNTDANAAIFSVAHYGTTTDLFKVVDELEKLW